MDQPYYSKTLLWILILICVAFASGRVYSQQQTLPDMVHVRGSLFTMGDDQGSGEADERPAHLVKLKGYSIAKTEITVLQWSTYCSSTNRAMPAPPEWGWIDHHPMVNITWNDAMDFCKWLSAETGKRYRLPTEAEWEYAARGGRLSKGFVFSGGNDGDKAGFYKALSPDQTQPIAQKDSNELGLYDMSGNVWEWVADWYAPAYPSPDEVVDPKGPLTGTYRIIRGCGWVAPLLDCRVTNRWRSEPDIPTNYIGFRPVMED